MLGAHIRHFRCCTPKGIHIAFTSKRHHQYLHVLGRFNPVQAYQFDSLTYIERAASEFRVQTPQNKKIEQMGCVSHMAL